MRTRTEALRAIAAHELRGALHGRMIPAFAVLFALLAVGIALAGLGGSGMLLVQGFTRTSISLLTLSLYLLPLLGGILGAAALGGEDGGTELLLAQPVSRAEALLGRLLGLALALLLVAFAGYAAAGTLVLARAGSAGIGGYLLSGAGAAATGLAGLGAGALLGVLSRRRSVAVGWALAGWFAAAVLYDLAVIAVLQVVGNGQPGPLLVGLLAGNPIDGVRVAATVLLGADVLLGPTGAALQRVLGQGGGYLWVLTSLVLWLCLPFAGAAAVYRRRDF